MNSQRHDLPGCFTSVFSRNGPHGVVPLVITLGVIMFDHVDMV